jgi:hypothetical protein
MLAPYLTREQAQRVLALDRGIGLARLASFGADEAARVLGGLYQDVERLPAHLVSVMTASFPDYQHDPFTEPDRNMWMATSRYGTPWWQTGIPGRSVDAGRKAGCLPLPAARRRGR